MLEVDRSQARFLGRSSRGAFGRGQEMEWWLTRPFKKATFCLGSSVFKGNTMNRPRNPSHPANIINAAHMSELAGRVTILANPLRGRHHHLENRNGRVLHCVPLLMWAKESPNG
ncbi:hypothetical protein CPC08DRAFT_507444 [Agrocybe pediades]|nr:hypothetical protein CPC08DRAFT_507444 [Agrocybe pediades]